MFNTKINYSGYDMAALAKLVEVIAVFIAIIKGVNEEVWGNFVSPVCWEFRGHENGDRKLIVVVTATVNNRYVGVKVERSLLFRKDCDDPGCSTGSHEDYRTPTEEEVRNFALEVEGEWKNKK